MIFAALAVALGCEAPPAPSQPQAVVDAQVSEVEQRVNEHLRRFAAASGQEAGRQVAAAPPPDINWSDPTWLARHPRDEQPTMNRPPAPVAALPPAPAAAPEPAIADPVIAEPVMEAAAPPAPLGRQELIAKLLEEVRSSDDPEMAKALAAVGLSLADPVRPFDESLLEPLRESQRRQVRQYHELVVSIGQKLADGGDVDPHDISLKLDALFQRPIAIKKFALCRRVEDYGVYEPFESSAFAAGHALKLGLYVELDHFGIADDGDRHVVRLSQEVTLFKDDLIVWREPVAEVVDRSRNRRRDFFTTQVIQLPATLGTGKYTLKLRVTDHVSQTLDETTQIIELVTDPALAGGQE